MIPEDFKKRIFLWQTTSPLEALFMMRVSFLFKLIIVKSNSIEVNQSIYHNNLRLNIKILFCS